nr:(2Fe-2S)-binding protein [Aquabacterium terrae]
MMIDGQACEAPPGSNVAALLWSLGRPARRSLRGEVRLPWCGMGVCGECRVTIDGRDGVLACLTPCRAGLRVQTQRGGRR